MDVIITLLIVVLLAYTIMKKIYPVMVLLATGIIVLFAYTIVTQTSVMGDATAGNIYIDIFEFIRGKYVTGVSGLGMVLMPVVGYAAYMNHIGASKLLAIKAIKPFENVKNPYILCLVAVLIGGLLRLAIPSQTGLIALLMVTIYPVMLASGMSKGAAASACVCGTAFDWGPACPTTALVLTNSTQQAQLPLFINYQLPIILAGLVVVAIISMFSNRYFDKKAGHLIKTKDSIDSEMVEVEKIDLPGFYAILPVIPLVAMIVFSEAVLGSIVISAFAATFMSFILVVIIEAIRLKGLKKSFEGSKQQFIGMGTCYAEMITLISSAMVFAGSVQLIGGFNTMSNFIINSGLPGILLIIVVTAMVIFMTMVVASSVPSVTTFAPFITGIAKAGGYANEVVIIPFIFADGISRAFSPISAANVFTTKFLNIEAPELIKRNAVPLLSGLITIIIISTIFV